MEILGTRNISSARFLFLCVVLALFVCPALSQEKKSSPHPAKPAAKAPPKSSVPAHSGGGTTAHGPTTTTSHGPTTSTAGHTTTGHGPTTTGHTTTTTPGHTATATRTAPGHVATGANAGAGRVPKGATVAHTKSGGVVTRRGDGKIASFHDPKRGMEVHRGLNGNRRVLVERSDHSRVFVEHGGHGYIQRPYMYHGHEYARRSYYYHGAYYHHYYGRYYYRGVYVNPYYPAYYYGPAYYGWAYNPWAAPVPYAWGWGGSPWYGYYGAYFTPYPVYAGPAFWLTDFVISTSLAAAYQAQIESQNQAAALSNPAPLSPEAKQLIADEVRRQIALENSEAQTAGQQAEPNAASSSIQRDLTDGVQHVFVAGQDLDVVDAGGGECALSQGDAIQLTGQTPPDSTSVNLLVLASKGGRECPKGDTVSVSIQDLQEMQNHMRETIDQGLQELQKKQGQGGLPAAPASAKAPPVESAMALSAPPPPPESEVKAQLTEQSKDADNAEREVASDTAVPAAASTSAEAPTVALGQTPDQVTSALGKPKSIMDLGNKKIYVYPDMKVTFNGGKVTDIK